MVHRTHVPNQNLDGIVRNVYLCCVPLSSFSGFEVSKTYFSHCSIAYQTKLIRVSVFKIYYRDMMYGIWNASFCQDDKNKVAIVKCCLIQLLKATLVLSFIVECFLMFIFSVLWAENAISPHRSLYQYMIIVNIFYVWKIIIVM